jgi:shikimate dehydrogenase
MKNFAVIGNPVGHSRSPEIFNSLFRHFGMDCSYTAFSLESPADLAGIMVKYDLSGVNITSPFKEEIFKQLKNSDHISKTIQAVNVVLNRSGSLYGFNTDVHGVTRSLTDNRVDVKDRKCLIIGGGGAARAAVYAVNELHGLPFICNRTDVKAEKISSDLGCSHIRYDELKDNLRDTFLLILTVPELSIEIRDDIKHLILLNADYTNDDLRNYCHRYIGGCEWLVHQAVKTFEHFFDRNADPEFIKKELKAGRNERNNIAIIGPAGSGKTTYGKLAAGHFGMEFIDTDEEIEKRTGKNISDLFISDGEDFFRRLEADAITDACGKKNTVISVGAGAISSLENRESLKMNCFVVLLDIDTDLLLSRLSESEISKRPKLKGGSLKEELEKLFDSRKQDYISCADILVQVRSDDAEKESEKIIRELDVR